MYKTNSSPSLLLTSENGSSIDPSELLDEEGYDISDNENDAVGELKNGMTNTLKRQDFKDSYDQFCRDGKPGGHGRLSSEEKTEADKNLVDGIPVVDMKDLNDVSSENSATESERVITPKILAEQEEKRRSKSSGYGDGSNTTSDSESVQELKHPLSGRRAPPYNNGYMTDSTLMNRRDHGYASDISTRSSPLDYKGGRNRYQPPSQRLADRMGYDPTQNYFSEDDSVRSSHSGARPMQPPPYTQALHDIERLSEKNDVTDSEEMYDHLLDMGRQLGVSLDDSIESDLNTKIMMPPPSRPYSNPRSFPPPPPVESGYLTDNSIGRDRYTDREKSERCAQLLNEFKSSKSRNAVDTNSDNNYDDELPIEPPTIRSKSVMENGFDNEEPRVPPVLRRSNSAGASGVYKEWLV